MKVHDNNGVYRGSRNKQPSISSELIVDAAQYLIEHLNVLADVFNMEYKLLGGKKIILDVSRLINRYTLFPNEIPGAAINLYKKKFLGKSAKVACIWDTQIKTFAEICFIHETTDKDQLVRGLTQSGKSVLTLLSNFLPVINYLHTDQWGINLILVPSQYNIANQTCSDAGSFVELYGDLEFCLQDSKKSISLNNYERNFSQVFEPQFANLVKMTKGNNIIRRTSSKDVYEKITDISRQSKELYVFVTIDEMHNGAIDHQEDRQCLQKKMLAELNVLEKTFDGCKHKKIGFSATPYAWEALFMWHMIRLRIGEDYIGYNMANGEPLDPNVKVRQPNCISFKMFAEGKEDLKFLPWVKRNWYISEKAYLKELKKMKYPAYLPNTHLGYKDLFLDATAALVNHFAEMNCVSAEGARGIIIRLFPHNGKTQEFLDLLKLHINKQIKIVEYFEDVCKEDLDDYVQQNVPEGPYLVITTGSLRMGNRIPRDVGYLADFTDQSEDIALHQGLLGRATGYGFLVVPTVVMSQANYENVKEYVDNMGKLSRAGRGMVLVPENGRKTISAPSLSVTVDSESINKISNAEDKIKLLDLWQEIIGRVEPNLKCTSKGKVYGNTTQCIWDVLKQMVPVLEKYSLCFCYNKMEILLPGEKDTTGKSYKMYPEEDQKTGRYGHGQVCFRDVDKKSKTNSNGRGNHEDLEVQFHVVKSKNGDYKIVAIKLRLKTHAKAKSATGKVLPKNEHIAALDMTKEEKTLLTDKKSKEKKCR